MTCSGTSTDGGWSGPRSPPTGRATARSGFWPKRPNESGTQLWPFAESIVNGTAKGEDVTFCLRAQDKGFTTWLSVDARIGHEKEWLL